MRDRAYVIKFPSKKSLTDSFYLLNNITMFYILGADYTTVGLGSDQLINLVFNTLLQHLIFI